MEIRLSCPISLLGCCELTRFWRTLTGRKWPLHPFLTRAAVEKLFGLKRRQAIELMHSVEGYQIGKTLVVDRARLAAWLRRASLGEQVWWEQVRHTRVEEALEEVRQEREARKQRAVVPPSHSRVEARGKPWPRLLNRSI